MSYEPFGTLERNWTSEEKEKIRAFLKYDNHVPLKVSEMVFSAEVEAEYFKRVGNIAGPVTFGIFFFFPIVRNTPALRRILISAIPGTYVYTWGHKVNEELVWGKTFAAWQKFMIYHGQHSKNFI